MDQPRRHLRFVSSPCAAGLVLRTFALSSLVAACGGSESQAPAARAAPEDPTATMSAEDLVRIADSYADQGKGERAEPLARKAVAKSPSMPQAHRALGKALMLQDKAAEAAESLTQAMTLGADDRETHLMLASCYDVSRHYEEALRIYSRWLSKNPRDAEVRQERGLTLLLVSRPEEAVTELEQAAREAPTNVQVAEDLGFALVSAGRHDQAIKVLTPVAQAEPHRTSTHLYMGQALAARGDPAAALIALDKAAAGAKDDLRPLRARALLKLGMDDPEGALADWEAVLRSRPGDAGGLLGAARALILLQRLDSAQTHLDQAWSSLGDQPQLSMRMAEVAWRRGDKGALAQLEKAAQNPSLAKEAWGEILAYGKAHKDKKLVTKAEKKLADLN